MCGLTCADVDDVNRQLSSVCAHKIKYRRCQIRCDRVLFLRPLVDQSRSPAAINIKIVVVVIVI